MMLEDPYDFTPQPASNFWGWTLFAWLIFIIGVCLAITWCASVQAAPVVVGVSQEGQPMRLRLLSAPCGEKVLVHMRGKVKPEVLRIFKAAALTWNGKVYASCWVDLGGQVYSIDETGDVLPPIPRAYFVDDSV